MWEPLSLEEQRAAYEEAAQEAEREQFYRMCYLAGHPRVEGTKTCHCGEVEYKDGLDRAIEKIQDEI